MPKVQTTTETIRLDGEEIAYELARSPNRKKTIQLSVDPDLGLKLAVPSRTTSAEIERFLIERTQWIRETQQKIERARPRKRDWNKGETVYLRGEPMIVVTDELPARDRHKAPVILRSLDGSELRVLLPASTNKAPRDPEIRDAVYRWYWDLARPHLISRTESWLPPWRTILRKRGIYRADVDDADPNVKISNARTRWGSCSLKRVINLSWRVIAVPDHLADYVIVHELTHLKELNHQRAFWELVGSLIPDWERRRKELRDWGRRIVL